MFSKKQIDKTGIKLKEGDITQEGVGDVIKYFREIHQHPMSLFRKTIDRKLEKYKINALVSQRLKRIPSIIGKLKNENNPNMKLSTMQDIGGLRVVVNTLDEVKIIRDALIKLENHRNFKFSFIKEDDYIYKKPKESGYRSIHLIYKYEKNVENHKKCRIEIQIRTKLQHSWATAVEVVGTYLNQPLKQSFGEDKYLDIFKQISKLFTDLENKNIDYDFIQSVEKNIKNTQLLKILQNFNIVGKHINKMNKGYYLLLNMNFKENTIEITHYSKQHFSQANDNYLMKEVEYLLSEASHEIVLISIKDIKNLKKSYPNYFMDTTDFINNLQKLFKIVEIINTNSVLENQDIKDLFNNTLKDMGIHNNESTN